MLPEYYINYINCMCSISKNRSLNNKNVVCEGKMMESNIRSLEKTSRCNIKEIYINGKYFYEIILKE